VVYVFEQGMRAYNAATGELIQELTEVIGGQNSSSSGVSDGETLYWKNVSNWMFTFDLLDRPSAEQ